MVNLTTHKLKLITKNRGIKNYQNVSREKLLSTVDKYMSISPKIYQKMDLNELQECRIFH